MSIFKTVEVVCPACSQFVEFEAVYSVNADRRPDLRDEILAGTFQHEACPKCGESFRLTPELTYLDEERGQWIAAFPADRMSDWETVEEEAGALFDESFGSKTPPMAQSIGAGLTPRVTFGWTGLREKLKAAEAGLDDTALELTKMAILGGLPDNKLRNDTELRLGDVENGDLVMVWVRSGNEMLLEGLRVPRKLYEDIRDDKDDWQPLRDKVSAGMYVDMLRLLLAAA